MYIQKLRKKILNNYESSLFAKVYYAATYIYVCVSASKRIYVCVCVEILISYKYIAFAVGVTYY